MGKRVARSSANWHGNTRGARGASPSAARMSPAAVRRDLHEEVMAARKATAGLPTGAVPKPSFHGLSISSLLTLVSR